MYCHFNPYVLLSVFSSANNYLAVLEGLRRITFTKIWNHLELSDFQNLFSPDHRGSEVIKTNMKLLVSKENL